MPRKIESPSIVVEENTAPVEEVMVETKSARKAYYAYADFKVGDDEYKAGDVFVAPKSWTRNLAQEELLLASKKKNSEKQSGLVFTYLGEVINPHEKNPELRERRVHNAILPLEER